jgi:hypothetical protein
VTTVDGGVGRFEAGRGKTRISEVVLVVVRRTCP